MESVKHKGSMILITRSLKVETLAPSLTLRDAEVDDDTAIGDLLDGEALVVCIAMRRMLHEATESTFPWVNEALDLTSAPREILVNDEDVEIVVLTEDLTQCFHHVLGKLTVTIMVEDKRPSRTSPMRSQAIATPACMICRTTGLRPQATCCVRA